MVGKSQDVKTQLRVWSQLLEGRIALQKVVIASRELPNGIRVEEETEKSLFKLLKTLAILRETIRKKGQFRREDEEEIQFDQQKYDDQFLVDRHESYNEIRDQTIGKWCEKTKVGIIPKKGYEAMEVPTLKLISNSLRDKERLVRRTQLDRTSHLDDSYDKETFNDDDFYHQLLREMISKDESRKWVELQRLRYKQKRKAETRATKGRKIKKDLIPKLVNFMAPTKPAHSRATETSVPEPIRVELLRSLFGGGTRQLLKEKETTRGRGSEAASSEQGSEGNISSTSNSEFGDSSDDLSDD